MTQSQNDLRQTYPLYPTHKILIFDHKRTILIIPSRTKAMNPLTKSLIKTLHSTSINKQYHIH